MRHLRRFEATCRPRRIRQVHDARTGELSKRLPWRGNIRELQFSPNGRCVLLTTENQDALHLVDLEQDRISQVIPIGKTSHHQAQFSGLVQKARRLVESK